MSNETKKIKIEFTCVNNLTIEANGTYSLDIAFEVSKHQIESVLNELRNTQSETD